MSRDGESFVIEVTNPTLVRIHLFGARTYGSKRDLMADFGKPYVDPDYPHGTLNIMVPPGKTVCLNAVVERGHHLLFAIYWRRMSGLHLFSFLPLIIHMSPRRLAAVTRAEEPSPMFYVG